MHNEGAPKGAYEMQLNKPKSIFDLFRRLNIPNVAGVTLVDDARKIKKRKSWEQIIRFLSARISKSTDFNENKEIHSKSSSTNPN